MNKNNSFERDEFAVTTENIKKLEKYKNQIKNQYKTQLIIPGSNKDGIVWISLIGQKDNLQAAKIFIKATCNPEETEIIGGQLFPLLVFTALQGFWHNGIERKYSVVIKPKHKRNSIKIQGGKGDVKRLVNSINLLHQQNNEDKDLEDKFANLISNCMEPQEVEILNFNIGIKKFLFSIIKDERFEFNFEQIRDQNIDQILEDKVLPTPRKQNDKSFFDMECNEESTSKVQKDENVAAEKKEKSSNKKSILGDTFGVTSQSKVKTESLEERKKFMKTPPADFLRKEFQKYGFHHDDIEATLLKFGSNFAFQVIYRELQDLQDERKKKFPFIDNDVEMISSDDDNDDVVEDDDDVTEADDDVIFVKETPASQEARDCEFVCYLPGFPNRSDVIKWFKEEYKVTNNTDDYVTKLDILGNFRRHFNLKTHHKIGENLFNTIAMFIVGDPTVYGQVKTKGRVGKRRYVCIKPTHDSTAPSRGGENSGYTLSTRGGIKSSDSAASSCGGGSSGILKDWINNKSNVPSTSTMTSQTNEYEKMLKPIVSSYNNVKEKEKPKIKTPPSSVVNTPRNIYPHLDPVTSSHNSYNPAPATTSVPTRHMEVTIPVVNSRKISQLSNDELLRLPSRGENPNLRSIVIDGSNVAVSHGMSKSGKFYSIRGIAICVHYFWTRGHRDIICFVPNNRKGFKGNPPIKDRDLVFKLEDMGIVKITPARVVEGRPIVCYDDRFILRLAEENDGIIVSNDQYRDLATEKRQWDKIIKTRLLPFTFVGDLFMPPEDPLGRNGPNLDQFLSYPTSTSALTSTSSMTSSKQRLRHGGVTTPSTSDTPTTGNNGRFSRRKDDLDPKILDDHRKEIEKDLNLLFPDKKLQIRQILTKHDRVWDLNVLVNFILEAS